MLYITGDTHRDFRRVAALCDTVGVMLAGGFYRSSPLYI